MRKLGLKLWSTNENYVNEAIRLYEEKFYDYIELFAVPDSYNEFIGLWKSLKIPYVLHAPHFSCGLNFAKRDALKNNLRLVDETLKFADALSVQIIIFHPGVEGDIKETAFQIKQVKDSRIVLENKPYYAINGDLICNGHSPEEIEYVMQETGVGFCFDIGHAICSANAKKIEPFEYLKKFNTLNPKLYHLFDGDWNGVWDEHRHFGAGSYNFDKILGLIPKTCLITLETKKDFSDSLKDFEKDIEFLGLLQKSF
jgi:deoxyribonuclease IV